MNKRIGYIDAVRGFSMLIVVYSHVLGFSFLSHPAFSFNDIFVTFMMPLFFFFFGALIRAYFPVFVRMLDQRKSMLFIVSAFIIVQFLLQLPRSREWIVATLSFYSYSLLKSVAGFLGIVVVFACFRKYRSFFENSVVGSKLQFLGARSDSPYSDSDRHGLLRRFSCPSRKSCRGIVSCDCCISSDNLCLPSYQFCFKK